jgi:hypothetical protein
MLHTPSLGGLARLPKSLSDEEFVWPADQSCSDSVKNALWETEGHFLFILGQKHCRKLFKE